MTLDINKIEEAAKLPVEWNNLTKDYFQTSEFLDHTEKYNPCKQRYYLLFQDGLFKAGAIVYTLRLDLLTYLAIPSPVVMKILGVPCSVSSSGIIGDVKLHSELIKYVVSQEKGLLLTLNLDSAPKSANAIVGRTLPTFVFNNTFHSWEDYIQSLRSDYRRRLIRLSQPFAGISMERGKCSQFDNVMYSQYLEVLGHSKGKLEKLTLNFFKHLPSNFTLITYFDHSTLIGWYISAKQNENFYFFMGGINYSLNKRFNTYLNILFCVLKEGIEQKATVIDMGQTADIPKTRLGAKAVKKFMIGYHSNIILRKLLKAGKGMLEYSTVVPETHVIR